MNHKSTIAETVNDPPLSRQIILNDLVQGIPGYVHINSMDGFNLVLANKNFENYFGLSTRQIAEMGKGFIAEYYCQNTWNNAMRHILRQRRIGYLNTVFGHVQKIRKSPSLPYLDFICSTRLITNLNCYLTDYVPASFFGIESKAINAISNCIEFTKTNHDKYFSLSTREKEIVHLIGTGKSRQEISDMLFISKHTLDNHRKHIRRKLGVKSTAELVHFINTFDTFS